MEDPVSNPTSHQRSWRAWAFVVVATVGVNVAFVYAVDSIATTEHHVVITLNGPSVTARFDDAPPARWDGAGQQRGRIGIRIRERKFANDAAGVDDLIVKALPSGHIIVRARFNRGVPAAWQLPPEWHVDHRGHLVTSGNSTLWLSPRLCGNCTIQLDLISVRSADILLRATGTRSGLLLRWQGETLAWHEQVRGHVGPAHGIVRLYAGASRKYDRFGAELASLMLPGYVDGWRFAWWYGRCSLPGLILMLVLGAWWRGRRFVRSRWVGPGRLGRAPHWWWVAVCGAVVISAGVLSVRSWIRAHLFFDAAALALLAMGAAVTFLTLRELLRMRATAPAGYRRLAAVVLTVSVVAMCAAAAGYSGYAAIVYLEGIPHVQDSVSYLLAAKAIAAGELKIPIAATLAPFFQMPQFFGYHAGYLYPLVPGLYFAGHPFLLALGYLMGAPWAVNPISSGITLGLLFLLCRELFGTSTGLLAVALGMISPFARFQAASMMTHTSALLFVTAALLFLVYWLRRGRGVYALCMGVALGALLNVRPYEAAVLAAYIGLVLMLRLRRPGSRHVRRGVVVAALGCTPFVILIVWQMISLGTVAVRPEWRALLHWIPENIDATRIRLGALNDDLFGWTAVPGLPHTLTLGLVFFAVLVLPKTRADWFIVGWALLYVVAYACYPWHGNMFGPRYWYPSLGGQLVLIARLLQALPNLLARLSCAIWPPGHSRRWYWLPFSAGVLPMALVAGPLFLSTLTTAYPDRYRRVYSTAYNGFSAKPQRLLAQHHVRKGLVFLADLPLWQYLATALAANDPSFDGNIIFARHIEGRDQVLMKARPHHTPYLITWNGSALELGRLRLAPGSNDLRYTPLPAANDHSLVIGVSNVFHGLNLPGGAGLLGGLATNDEGDIYVVDAMDHEVLVFDSKGVLRRRVRASYSFGPAAIKAGHGIAVDSDGNVYVADLNPPGVVRLNADGTFAWRGTRSPDGQQHFGAPYDLALLPDGNLVVTDIQGPCIHILRRDGTFAGYYGGPPSRAPFRKPYGIAVGPGGHVYVSDVGLRALIELDQDATEVRRWPLPLQSVEPFQVPYVAVDVRGHAYVANMAGWVVYHARPGKNELETLGVSIRQPSGIAARGEQLFILAAGDRRVLPTPLP